MAYNFYISMEGVKQGRFKGELTDPLHKDKMGGVEFGYGITVHNDPVSGQASGKRQHKPIVIVKEWGAATPQILTALATNEVLKSVSLEFVRALPGGAEEVFQTIKLTGATVIDMQQYTSRQPSNIDAKELDRVEFAFHKIEITNKDGNTTFTDDWLT
jgi:type VI secretion system secreted protein Hcp